MAHDPENKELHEEQIESPAVRWTEEQRRVIDARDRSLLVSAAAGSGKTAVLVERILSRVTDPEHPIDVDELLVVTFTNAAAAEMRERLLNSLSAAADAHPADLHLQRQMALIHNAQITTIDSFCLQVVRNHFHRIDLEPGFRIADEGELTLLREDVCAAVLEDFYAQGDSDFLRFANGYSAAKSDRRIRDMVLELYRYSQSYPWPDEWLRDCETQYRADSAAELEGKPWVASYLAYHHAWAEEACAQYRQMSALAEEPDGPGAYLAALSDEREQLSRLTACDSLAAWKETLPTIEFGKLPAARGCDKAKAKQVQDVRNRIKKKITDLRQNEFAGTPEDAAALLRQTGAMAGVLITLTRAFSERFAEEKAKRNILDFSDGEHFALRILVDPETKEPTETALEYRLKFKEVMIDEYQDSNYLQEAILTAVSGGYGENRFLVGDVKQSIYGFRLARPELFTEKQETFSRGESSQQRIDLSRNFRSRPEILSFVNDLFARIMGRDLGDIAYDADAALYPGREAEADDRSRRTECIRIEPVEGEDKHLTEARFLARQIRAMVEEQELPGIAYRDVVILLRAMTGWTQAFVTAFEEAGVPLLVSSQTGYFAAPEVQVVLAMLRVLDNESQDIPLATLLRSPIGGFSDEELARIRAADATLPFAESARRAAEGILAVPEELKKRLERFWAMLAAFRVRVSHTPIHTLLAQIYEETGYRDYVTALPAGEQRRANLDMLLEKAVSYEQTSYHGLYHFVRYIDRLIKYDVEVGEAETISERENAVRLTTIHKSKGLEYPVVFVAGLGKQFNLRDTTGDMVFHQRYGVALKYCDAERRTKTDTLIRRAFSLEARKDSLGEELRVLYVALTRARDKLILTGVTSDEEKPDPTFDAEGRLSFTARLDAKCPWDWVAPALRSYGNRYRIDGADSATEEKETVRHDLGTFERKAALTGALRDVDETLLADLDARFSWQYPYHGSGTKQKLSVSELKHRAMNEARAMLEEDDGEELFPEEIPVPYVPKFVQTPEENRGALRGTAFHRLLECLPFSDLPGGADPAALRTWLSGVLTELRAKKRLEEEQVALLDLDTICRFLATETARRMAAAAARGVLLTEQPFVMLLPAAQVQPDAADDEEVLIQGIIDAFWEEDDDIVLLDYKTDRVNGAGELLMRYQAQLDLYAEALGRRFAGKRVREAWIYSFCLNQEIRVPSAEREGTESEDRIGAKEPRAEEVSSADGDRKEKETES